MILSITFAGLAYGSLALATLGCIIFGLVHWNRQSLSTDRKKDDSGNSAAA